MPEDVFICQASTAQSPLPKPNDSAGTASGHRTSLPLQFPAENHQPASSQTNKRVGHEQARHTPEPRANLGLYSVNVVEFVRLAFLRALEAIRFVVLASLWKPQQTNPWTPSSAFSIRPSVEARAQYRVVLPPKAQPTAAGQHTCAIPHAGHLQRTTLTENCAARREFRRAHDRESENEWLTGPTMSTAHCAPQAFASVARVADE
ncbi:hypothetical protein CCHR01_00287 [Colletotrichum chrysophilum]|uniref:Uncharacterized protein n=1 Tax=Colletotrichum chrysophilum TaxID=1836956 RepID=A0AAD9AYT3_9PEZI|nr:hypothetical protein CCHR01_00287 [Colletotrichum chrysophilum]